MKKVFALTLVLVMAIALASFSTANAAEKVVYLKEGGTGNGSSASAALGTLQAAYEAIGATDNGTIVVVGSVNFPADANWTEPAHTGKITITGKYNGTDHAGIIVNPSNKHWLLSGPVTFDAVVLNLTSTMVIRARNNPIEFTSDFTSSATSGFPQLYLVGGDQSANVTHNLTQDINMILNGGTFLEVIAFARSGVSGDYTGTAHIRVGGSAKINKLTTGNRATQTNNCGSLDLILDGGVITGWVGYGDSKTCWHTGTVTIYVTKNFNIADSFDDGGSRIVIDSGGNGIFYGINGASSFYNDPAGFTFRDTMKASRYLLKVDAEIYDAILASDKLNKDSFTDFEKVGASAGTTAPSSTTAAPSSTTKAGTVTTAAPSDTGSPQTGDILYVLSAAALLATVFCIVIARKKSRA